jgi:hypothetical protein
MKVVIEIEIPDGQDLPDPRDIVRLTSPDWHCDWWHISDVQSAEEDLTDEEAREVLGFMARKSDANVGINWDSIGSWAAWVREERPEEEEVVYGFLCHDPKKEFPFGIELSDTEDGSEIFDTEWYKTAEERRWSINASPEWVFPRGKE